MGTFLFLPTPIVWSGEELPQDLKKKKEGGGGFQVEFIRVGGSRRQVNANSLSFLSSFVSFMAQMGLY